MRCLTLLSLGLLLVVAAGPTSQPTSKPASKPTTAPAPQPTIDAAIRVMPEYARHKGAGKWTYNERCAATNWLKDRLNRGPLCVVSNRYVWEGGPQRRVNLKIYSLQMWGLRWHGEVFGLLTEEAEQIVLAQKADKPKLTFHGWVTKVECDTKEEGETTIYLTLENIWIEPPGK